LTVVEPTALSVLDSDRIQNLSPAGAYAAFSDAQWGDLLPKLVQLSVARSLEDAGFAASISRPLDTLAGDLQLALDVRKFHLAQNLMGEVELGAKLIDAKGRIVASRIVRDTVAAESSTGPAAASALTRAFAGVAAQLATWTVQTVTELNQSQGVVPKKASGG
jgi:ABC-type uncharacterized transport system auxiliary subunit